MTASETLAQTMEQTRNLTLFYFNKLKDQDIHKQFVLEGLALNNAFWIMAHLAVTENFLLLHSIGAEREKISWARNFGLGSEIMEPENCPMFEEVKTVMNSVHAKAMNYVRSLTDEDLLKPTINGVNFGGEDSVKSTIMHAIRHEGGHTGQLGWLCKLYGIKTF